MLSSGQLLADRYRLGHRIAVGGMGEVWQAVDVRLDRTVAVKVLKAELCGDAEFLHRFRTEARTTASLNHPGIAAVHDYGETAAVPDGPQDTAYLVMELVEGEPLAAILAREGRINTDHTVDMLEQAGRALQAAHERGLVHRDVKPGNILIGPDGAVKLTDFGIAKAADAAPVTRSGMVMGTAHYIAPEQALGSEASPSSDVYSLTVVGYECLMGHRPFLSDNAVTVAMMHIRDVAPPLPPDVPPGVRALIEATLVKDPRRRYATGGEFANAVACVRSGMPLPTPAALVQQQPVPGAGTSTHQPVVQPNTPQPGMAQSGVHQQVAPQQIAPQQVPQQQLPPQQATPQQPGMGGTFPPGVVPPQPAGHPGQPPRQPTAQRTSVPGGPAALGRQSRTVFWALVAVFTIILLVVVGLATYWTVSRSEGLMHGVRSTPGVAAAQSITAAQQAPMTSAPASRGDRGANGHLDPATTLGHTSPQHAFMTGRESASRTDPAQVGGTSHTARDALSERGAAA